MVYTSDYPIINVTVDVVYLTVHDGQFEVLLVERGGDPFRGRLAFPGGFVEVDEDLEHAARRELQEETGLAAPPHLEQLATYGRPDRDPRGRTVSVVHLALGPFPGQPEGGSDAAAAGWYDVGPLLDDPERLAFDHAEVLADAVERTRSRLEYSTVAAGLCPDDFTIGELRHVYEVIWDAHLDPANFHRKVTHVDGFLVESAGTNDRTGGRPAQLYRRGSADRIHPPLNRRALAGEETR